MTEKQREGEQKKKKKRLDERRKSSYSKTQQFTEQMDQLCRPNYREEEVGNITRGSKQAKTEK